MTVFALKLLAMASMICDHLGYWLYAEKLISPDIYTLLRSFGRMAFPIFCFLLVNGSEHSANKKAYLTRLCTFAFISQIPYVLVLTPVNYGAKLGGLSFQAPAPAYILLCLLLGYIWYRFVRRDKSALYAPLALFLGLCTIKCGDVYFLRPDMNVFYTLAVSLAAICVLDSFFRSSDGEREKYFQAVALIIALLLIRDKADYGLNGILLIISLWFFRESNIRQLAMLLIWCFISYPPAAAKTGYTICAALAALPLYFYNGRLGKPLKTAFYLVYPLHLSVLGIAALL